MSAETKTHSLVVKMTFEELSKLHALASDLREPLAVVVRRWVRDSYRARFGDTAPPPAKFKHEPKKR